MHTRPVNRWIYLVVVFVVLFLSPGCQKTIKTPADTLVVGIEASPLTLDPRLAADAYSLKISELIHNGLFRLNERLEIVPDLVEAYEFVVPDLYHLHLRPGVTFHDGQEFDAEDVKYTLESVRDPALRSAHQGAMNKIDTITVVDPLNLDIRLKEPFAPFLSELTMGIVSSRSNDVRIGTGPYQFVEWKPEQELSFQRNDQYFRRKPRMPKVVFKIIPDDNLRVMELKRHRIDVLQNNIPQPLLKFLADVPGLQMERTEGVNVTYLGMNLRKGPLQKPEVRRAILEAIDIPSMVAYHLAGLARPATGLLSPVHWAYEGEVEAFPYDPKGARELLDRAGLTDPDGDGPLPRFTLTYKTSTKKDRIGVARQISKYLKEVGIEVQVVPLEWRNFFSELSKASFDLYSLTWVGIGDPDIYYTIFHSSQTPPEGLNRGGYSNILIDQLTLEGRRLMERNGRRDIYREAQKLLSRELPMLPLWFEDNVAVFSRRVKGLKLRPSASYGWVSEVHKE